jgi:hypothetical protein
VSDSDRRIEYRVISYSPDALLGCLAAASLAEPEDVKRKLHLRYFTDYFAELAARTIVVEPGYIDHDYLEDYAAYYVRCFETYKRTTTRLHFFRRDFSASDFRSALTDADSPLKATDLQGSYLGFVVVKPLPQTIIGRTCLVTYPDDGGRRLFPILRDYEANLLGIPLTVRSLAYQEQDTVVAACATSALWSCFQGTGKLFQHAIPSPVEITKAATRHVPEDLPGNNARALPNSGLTAKQMAIAIRDAGLEPSIVAVPSAYLLDSLLYAYLRCRIPLILAVRLYDVVSGTESRRGAHAMTVTGFSLGRADPEPYTRTGFLLRATRIDKIYAHDDQVGPFSRMIHARSTCDYLATSWSGPGTVEARPWFLLVPLYHKIRIPFETVHDAILELDRFLDPVRPHVFPALPRIEWDIFLTTVNQLKNDILCTLRPQLGTAIEQTLIANLPRFIWRVTARCSNDCHLELLFDATGIAQHNLLVHVVEVRPELPTLIAALAPYVSHRTDNRQTRMIFGAFAQSVHKSNTP